MGGRRDIEAHHILQFLRKSRVVGQLELTPAMGRQPVRLPDRPHGRRRQPHRLTHGPDRPVRRLMWGWLLGQADHLRNFLVRCSGDAGWSGLFSQQAIDARMHEPLLPAPDAGFGLACGRHDSVCPKAISAEKNYAAAPDMLLGRRRVKDDRLKPRAIFGGDGEGYSCAHHIESHTTEQMGIPNRAPLFRSIH